MAFPPYHMPTWAPFNELAAVTPNDGAGLTLPTSGISWRGLWVGTGGNVKVDALNQGTGITFANVPSGTLLPVQVTKVYATGTTASNLVVGA